MPEEPTDLILEHLCALRKGQERMGEGVDEAVARLGSIETQIANLHREMAHVQGELARHDQRFDSLDGRPDRIERRPTRRMNACRLRCAPSSPSHPPNP